MDAKAQVDYWSIVTNDKYSDIFLKYAETILSYKINPVFKNVSHTPCLIICSHSLLIILKWYAFLLFLVVRCWSLPR